jgi:hypothetical protein
MAPERPGGRAAPALLVGARLNPLFHFTDRNESGPIAFFHGAAMEGERMSKFLAGIAALTLVGAAVMPIQASATEREAVASTASKVQSTEFSSRHRYWRHRHYGYRHYYGPRRYYGPRYGYYGYPRYYSPGVAVGIGPFGFRAF